MKKKKLGDWGYDTTPPAAWRPKGKAARAQLAALRCKLRRPVAIGTTNGWTCADGVSG